MAGRAWRSALLKMDATARCRQWGKGESAKLSLNQRQCRREESKGESEKLSPWSEGIGEADSIPSMPVPQKGEICTNETFEQIFQIHN